MAHSLIPLVVEHLAKGAQGDGAMNVAITHKLGLDLRRRKELHCARLLSRRTWKVEIDIEKLLLGSTIGKQFDVVAELLNLVGGEPIDEALLHQSHCLGIEAMMVDGMLEGRVDVLDVEGEEAAVARLVGEKLELVARGAIRCYAHTPFLGAAVWGTDADIRSGD